MAEDVIYNVRHIESYEQHSTDASDATMRFGLP